MATNACVTDYDCFREYQALTAHFSPSNYDYFKYGGNIKSASVSAWNKRKDMYFFWKLSEMSDPRGFMIANMRLKKVWVGDLINDPEYLNIYRKWKGYRASFIYNFKQEIELFPNLKDSISFKGNWPRMLQAMSYGKLSMETAIMIDRLTGCFEFWDNKLKGDIVWDEVYRKIRVYAPFIGPENKAEVKKILLDKYV